MNIIKIFIVTTFILVLLACATPQKLTEPCVGTDDSPCGEKQLINKGLG